MAKEKATKKAANEKDIAAVNKILIISGGNCGRVSKNAGRK